MKKLKRKFAISILAMIFAVVALGSTTFAWFTMTGKAEVSSIQASVRGGDGLEIRLKDDATHSQWTAGYLDLASSDFFKDTLMDKVNLAPIHYRAIDGTTPAFQKVKQTGRSVEYIAAEYGDSVTDTKDYVKFTLQFRSVQAGFINLVKESAMVGLSDTENGSFSWTPDASYKKTYGGTPNSDAITTSAANAARILTVENNATTLVSPIKVNVFENKVDTAVGNTKGLNTYSEDFGAVGYFKAKTNITDLAALVTQYNVPTSELGETVSIATLANPGGTGTGTEFFDNKDYYYAEVAVYIYIEGWDKECLNALFKSGLKIDLAFEQANEPAKE